MTLALFPELAQEDGAELSLCQLYRYLLWREWSGAGVCFIMLNPSVADATVNDNTIRLCMGYARRWHRRGIVRGRGIMVLNMYALRSTDPAALALAADPLGPENDTWLRSVPLQVHQAGGIVVCAWGAHKFATGRALEVVTQLRAQQVPLHVLRFTGGGHPHHPLRLPADLLPLPWPVAA